MPPKLRRPGAAPGAVVRGRGLRRPAKAAEEAVEEGEGTLVASTLTLDQCRGLKDIVTLTGTYWEATVQAALKVREVYIKDGELWLRAEVLGTRNETLLRWASEKSQRVIEVHLCPDGCTGGPHAEGVLHMRSFQKLGADREPWMSNMLPEEKRRGGEDELAELREDQRRLRSPPQRRRGDGREDRPPSISSGEKDKAPKKKSKDRKKKRKEMRVESQKEIKVIFGHTGLDPDPAIRRRFRRRAARVVKRKGKETSDSSSSSSASSPSETRGDPSLFGASSRVQLVAKKLPGSLGAAAVEEIADNLVTADGGLWETHSGCLPPLFMKYYKHHLAARMSPAMSREAHTLCQALDLLMRGKVAEGVDLCAQRVKSLEMMANGCHYTVSQQQELLPREGITISTTAEFQEAARRAREDGRARAEAARPFGSRPAGTPRTDEWAKGSGKKGDKKGKQGKADQKKGDGDKADGRKGKGS